MIAGLALECETLLARLQPLLDQLRNHVINSSGYVYFQEGTEPPLQDQEARLAIAQHLSEMRYPGPEQIGEQPQDRFMALALPPALRPLIEEINRAKKDLQDWHESLARTQPNAYAAAQLNRAVLKRAGEPLLNLQMAERALLWLNGQPVRLSWHYNTTSNSRRKTLGDALEALEKLADKLPDFRLGDVENARLSLASIPLNTPVAHRPSKPITHLKCQYRYIDTGGKATRGICYAKNPIFYPTSEIVETPTITLPGEVTGKKRRQGAGRPSLISDIPVCPLLPTWFWYKN